MAKGLAARFREVPYARGMRESHLADVFKMDTVFGEHTGIYANLS